jgi:hypothetical protein
MKNKKEEDQIGDLVNELSSRKDIELRARFEKEQIQKTLKEI